MSKCLDTNKFSANARIVEYFEKQEVLDRQRGLLGSEEQMPKTTRLINSVKNFISGKNLSPEKQQKTIERALKRFVKEQKGEQAALAGEILSRVQAHPMIQDLIYHEIVREASRYNQNNPVSQMEWFTNDKFERVPVLETMPVPALRLLQWKTYNAINGGRMFKDNRGLIGNLEYEWGSPRQMALRDPSGLMFAINQKTETFTLDAQKYANSFLDTPTNKKARQIRDFGANSIRSDVHNFARISNLSSEDGFRLFSEVMGGRTVIDESGKITRYANEIEIKENVWRWKNEVPFEYKGMDGETKVLESLSKNVDDFIGESSYDAFMKTINEARTLFKELGNELVAQIEFNAKEEGKLKREAKEAGLTEFLDEQIGVLLDPDLEIAGLNAANMVKKGEYFPRMWLRALVPAEFENSIETQKSQLDKKRLALNNPESKLNAVTRNRLLKEINNHQGSIIALEEKLSYLRNPETPIDPHTGQPTNTRVYYKNFKNLTRVLNPDYMRVDEDVMMDYIQEMSRAVTRNKAVIAVGKALLKAKKAGANDNTINASMGIFNTTFYTPQAASQFMGIDMNPNKVSQQLASAGINISGRQLTNYFNALSAYSTFNLLWGPLQGMVNATAWMLKIDRSGMEMVLDAEAQMQPDHPNFEFWKGLSRDAGMDTFQDFVGSYFNRVLRPDERKANSQQIKRLKGLIKEAQKTGKVKKLVQYKNQLKNTTDNRVIQYFNKAAQFAITRQMEYTKNAPLYKKALAGVANLSKTFFPTIDKTENMLRSRSFVIGAMQAVKSGRAARWDSKEAIEAGIDYAMATDFGLSHQHVGAALRGPIAGSTINKMKIWHNQKSGSNWRTMRNDVISRTSGLKNPNTLENKFSNMIKLGVSGAKIPMNMLFNFNPFVVGAGKGSLKAQRDVNPYTATNFSRFIREGFITAIMDLVVFAPGATFFGANAIKRQFFDNRTLGKGMQGMGNSTISLGIAIAQWSKFLLSGREEDKPNEDRSIFQKALRAGPIGIGGMSAIAGMMYVHQRLFDKDAAAEKDKSLFEDHFRRGVTPYLPMGQVGYDAFTAVKEAGDIQLDKMKQK